jgi:ribosomal protein S12 methylthiotransferase
MPGHVGEEVRIERRERLMLAQQEVAFEWLEAQVGSTRDVLIDAPVPDQPGAWIGRTYADAPEIDGVVYVSGERLEVGKVVACEIVATSGYDLVAAAVGEPR